MVPLPTGVELDVPIIKRLEKVGFPVKGPKVQEVPAGRPLQDNVTGSLVTIVLLVNGEVVAKVAVIVLVPELPCGIETVPSA